jgi:hypothetical protein
VEFPTRPIATTECPHTNTTLVLILYACVADKVQTKSRATLRHLSVTNIASQFRIATDICYGLKQQLEKSWDQHLFGKFKQLTVESNFVLQ